MKKLIALLLALLLVCFLFAACTKRKNKDDEIDLAPYLEDGDGNWSHYV